MWRPIPLGRTARGVATVAVLALTLTIGGLLVGGGEPQPGAGGGPGAVSAALPATVGVPSADLGRRVGALQRHLKAQPRDAAGWAALGAAYIEQARLTADPTRYTQAQQVLRRSLRVRPEDNDAAVAGQAALAAARHDFASALRLARRALAVNPLSESALCVRVDALVELGRYREAFAAVRKADAARPGIPVFTRVAYVLELRGQTGRARQVLEQALESAATPGDVAYVAGALGELARSQGDYSKALKRYAAALRADPDYLPALLGKGRVLAAKGDLTGATKVLGTVVRRQPLPAHLALLGELYEAQGRPGMARQQYEVVDVWVKLARANKVATDLETALVAADHGDRAEALRAARAEWRRRHSVHTADALAWALHANGKDEEALAPARRATGAGYRNASFLYHRGMIERSLGRDSDARKHLRTALGLDPGFSPVGGARARSALKALGGQR